MTTILRLKPAILDRPIPVDASPLIPERLAGRTSTEIARLPLLAGRTTVPAGDLFDIGGGGSEEIAIEGDLRAFSRIGAGMTRGSLTVRGPAGPRAGSGMSGGVLQIEGDAAGYAGEGMRGGALIIGGAAGDHLAAPPAGRPHGMNRGTILVRGGVGALAGFRMRRGTIVVTGDAGPCAGAAMQAGTLIVLGRLGKGAGALMRRGTIVSALPFDPPAVFPEAGRSRCPWLSLYYDPLQAAGVALPSGARAAHYRRHVGDLSGAGRGEILIMERPS